MHTAISARMLCILGASLAAIAISETSAAESSRALLGIDSGSTKGIDSGSALGIDSGSAQGIDSGSTAGIDSGSALGIDSGSTAGIDSGSALGIDSGSTAGIDSGSALGIDSGSTAGIDSGSALGIDSGSAPLLGGPIASIDHSAATFVALGQTVDFSGIAVNDLQVGDYVLVGGTITGAGSITADHLAITGEQYVPGATEVFVTGIPSSVDYSLGAMQIGELLVDYTLSMGGLGFEGIGAAITVIGTQPAFGGKMLSDEVVDMTDLFLRD